MYRTVSQENTQFRSKQKFMSVIFSKTRPTHAPKGSKKRVISCDVKKAFDRIGVLNGLSEHTIN